MADLVGIESQLTITSLPKKFLILVCDLIGVDGPPTVLRPPALGIISDWSTFAE